MKHAPIASTRQRVNILLDRETVAQARELGINLSRALGDALAAEVKLERDRRWANEHRTSAEYWNRWVEKNGLPLEKWRSW